MRPMATRRSARPSQVRPRPPSTGRPEPTRVRPRSSFPSRIGPHREIRRSPGLPLVVRLLLALSVVALGAVVLVTATGGLAKLVGGVGSAVGGIVDQVSATETPPPTPVPVIGAPSLTAPVEAYTNLATVDLTGTVPPDVVGQGDYRIRIYLALKDQPPAPITEAPVGSTSSFTIPSVTLTKGINDFSATIVAADGTESPPSAVVRYVYDTSIPKIILTSPKDGAVVNADTVTLVGKTQARSKLTARNEANNASVTGTAAGDGTFKLTLPLEKGPNGITMTTTDPAGNTGSLVIGVTRGSGALTATLKASGYRFKVSLLPHDLTLTAVVTDPDGQPLEGAAVTFTLSIPGVPVLTQDATTDATGTATFRTTVPQGATVGTGPATVFVSTPEFGTTSARTVIAIFQ